MFFKLKKNPEKIQRGTKLTQQQEFNNIMKFAEEIFQESDWNESSGAKHPIFEVIYILGRKIQSDYMVNLLKVEDESNLKSILPPFMFEKNTMLTQDGRQFSDLISTLDIKRKANLRNDTVLPWAWKRQRLIKAITNIGQCRKLGPWKEDELNHSLELWLPIGLYWVWSGNHSLSVGILQGNGTISTEAVNDISEIYNYVTCDGMYYFREFDKSIIGEVKNIEIAAIFEIGRLMTKHNITY
ncbi:hypothetical protein M3196_00335 [Fictibacillus nanhaiensis]|uniref:DUF6710 family protein n=1 Tax=Fictibacillus nanhaiensis TaxID=742169 RepID=UPI00203E0EB6|nr:DUF6710 family protein [Fictibacillus nanhaiensis]MCM3730115.1 hypothetical protein [Fictibacillus nanhaiensis]